MTHSTADRHSPKRLAVIAGMLSIYIFWGSTYLAMKFAIESIPPFLMAGIRFSTAGVIFILWRLLSGDALPTARQVLSAAVVGLFLLVGGNGCVVWAEQHVDSGITSVLVATAPLWMIVIDAVFLKRRPTGAAAAGVILGFTGTLLLVGPAQVPGLESGIDKVGTGVLLVAAVLWAAGSLIARDADLPASPMLGSGLEMLCAGVVLLLIGTANGEWSRFSPAAVSARSLYSLGFLIFFGSLAGFGAYTWLLRNVATTVVSTYAYVNPVIAVFLGAVLAHEPVTPRTLWSTAIIISAVMLINIAQSRGRKVPAVESEPVRAA